MKNVFFMYKIALKVRYLLYFRFWGSLTQKMVFFEKVEKIEKFMKQKVLVTFLLLQLWKNDKYESDAKFYEVFENRHHLSDLLK